MASYAFPWGLFLALSRDLRSGHRSLTADSTLMLSRISPPPVISGCEGVPTDGPVLLTANHYQRRGLWIGWPGAVATAAVAERRTEPVPVHWLVTGGLRCLQPLGRGPEVPATRWIFNRVATIYGMTALPLSGLSARARALRSWVRCAEQGHVLGIFPEGQAGHHAGLRAPQDGFPRLCHLLATRSVPVIPVGCYEQDGALHIRFGECLSARPDLPPVRQAERIMQAIAVLLPPHLRGAYVAEPGRAHDGAVD